MLFSVWSKGCLMINQNKENSKNQNKVFLGIVFLVVLCALYFTYASFSLGEPKQKHYTEKQPINLPSDNADAFEIWRKKLENQNDGIAKRLDFLQKSLLEHKNIAEIKERENSQLQADIHHLKDELQRYKKSQQKTIEVAETQKISDSPFSFSHETKSPTKKPPLQTVVAERSETEAKNVKNDIPAGTTVQAVIISSIDAPCGVMSKGDPQPVKLRILDNGHLPKGVMSKLKGGIVLAGGFGDISSERVQMRIERLTLVRSSGDFVETSVAGFVSGEDGKYGVRGCVVDKSGKMVGNAAMSGIFSGLNDYLQSCNFSNRECYCGRCDYCLSYSGGIADAARSSAYSGVNNAFDRLTEYYIQRAEQIQPVIQVTAGRIVDITFTHGCSIGDLNIKKEIEKERVEARDEDYPYFG